MKKIQNSWNRIELFLASYKGARFFNFAYSIGAAIVIWGALFKILHLPGGNFLLALGMGTEVLMFILTAFDRPGRYSATTMAEYTGGHIETDNKKNIRDMQENNIEEAVIETSDNGNNSLSKSTKQPLVQEIKISNEAVTDYNAALENIVKELGTLREETERMTRNVAQLNAIYAAMITAMSKPKE